MSSIQAIILGIIQGLTEFLPISSSGHLVIFQKLFGLQEGVLSFDIALHIGTLIPIFMIFWKDIWEMITHPLSKKTLLVIAGTIPTAIMGLLFKDLFDELFKSGRTLGIEFIITGLVLLYADDTRSKNKKVKETSYLDATVVGVAQGIAILPAVSRSGLTLAGSLARGLNREWALKFAFLLSIPSILGAAVLDLKDVLKRTELQHINIAQYGLGILTSAVAGFFAIKIMINVLRKGKLRFFSYYVFILAVFILFDQLFTHRLFGSLF